MANTVSVEQASTDALVAWLASQMPDVQFWDEWPDAGIAFPTGGAVSILKIGAVDETPVRPPAVTKRVDDPIPAITSVFTYRTHACDQPMQMDVWATSKARRDDIINRIGDALTASKRQTLAALIAAEGLSVNQEAVEQTISLQLAAPWSHLVAAYQFEAPSIDDTQGSSKRREFRATYRGNAYFDRTVNKRVTRLITLTVPITKSL